MAGMTVREDRLLSVNFSTPYATSAQVIIVKEDSAITGAGDLADKSIVCRKVPPAISTSARNPGCRRTALQQRRWAVQALIQGKVSAVVIDSEPAKVFVKQNQGLKILPRSLYNRGICHCNFQEERRFTEKGQHGS